MVSGGIISEGTPATLTGVHPPHFPYFLENVMPIKLTIRNKIIKILLKLIGASETNDFDIAMAQWNHGVMKRIIITVCNEFDVHPKDILGQRRQKNLILPRHICWWLAREETMFSYPQIGRMMKRDHTSIIYGCKKIDRFMSMHNLGHKEIELRQKIIQLKKQIGMEEDDVTGFRRSGKNSEMDSQRHSEIRFGIPDRTTKPSSDSKIIRPSFDD